MLNNGTLPFRKDSGAGAIASNAVPWETGAAAASPSGDNAGSAKGDGNKL